MDNALIIAVGSTDGKVINAHFGRAPQFLMFSLSSEGFEFLEVRENKPSCSNLNQPAGTMEDTIDLISDCQYVLISRIGPPIIARLKDKNIIALERKNIIEDELKNLIKELF